MVNESRSFGLRNDKRIYKDYNIERKVVKHGGRIIVNVQPLYSDYIPSHHMIGNYFFQHGLIWKGEILWEKNNYNCKYTAKKYGHPAMFPQELVKRALTLFTYKNDIVPDPFNGAGTTTLVASRLGRRHLGIDVAEEYCPTAEQRLNFN